jgi:hypothetical protein
MKASVPEESGSLPSKPHQFGPPQNEYRDPRKPARIRCFGRNRARRELRTKFYCVEHIDADRLYERAQQPWRRGLAWRYTAAELRIINVAKRREAKG